MSIDELKDIAIKNNIPIMRDDTLDYIKSLIIDNRIESILEIGTAIAYSTIFLALINTEVQITTIERDLERYNAAQKNISEFNLQKRIESIYSDALDIDVTKKYDLIIIDAAKSKNIEFFEKFQGNLNSRGYIAIDNTDFHGMVGHSKDIKNRRTRSLVRKIESFIEYTHTLSNYEVIELHLGDGLIVCRKKD